MDVAEFAMSFFSLEGENAIVTGGNTGLGRAFALAPGQGQRRRARAQHRR